MKKTAAVLVLVLVACACVYAGSKITATINPFSFQGFTKKIGGERQKINSKYGFGGAAGYVTDVYDNVTAGGEVRVDSYLIKGTGNFTDLLFLAKGAYTYNINDKIDAFGAVKAGLDLQMHSGATSAVFEFGFELGAQYPVYENINVFASFDMLFGFPKGISEIRLTPSIGATYAL